MAIRNTFKAYERLKREQHIDTLFHSGKAFSVFPVKFLYILVPCRDPLSPVLAGFSVPKKRFSSSVSRHRVRRLMAEAWRLHKQPLYAIIPSGHQLHIFLIFTSNETPPYKTVEEVVVKGVDILIKGLPATGQ